MMSRRSASVLEALTGNCLMKSFNRRDVGENVSVSTLCTALTDTFSEVPHPRSAQMRLLKSSAGPFEEEAEEKAEL
jgi:hypothetical protein